MEQRARRPGPVRAAGARLRWTFRTRLASSPPAEERRPRIREAPRGRLGATVCQCGCQDSLRPSSRFGVMTNRLLSAGVGPVSYSCSHSEYLLAGSRKPVHTGLLRHTPAGAATCRCATETSQRIPRTSACVLSLSLSLSLVSGESNAAEKCVVTCRNRTVCAVALEEAAKRCPMQACGPADRSSPCLPLAGLEVGRGAEPPLAENWVEEECGSEPINRHPPRPVA